MSKKIEKLFVKTYGCQMNVFDSERIEESLGALGIRKVNKPQASDLILLNTCHIREKAAEKVYSEIGRLKAIKSKNGKPSTGQAAQRSNPESRANDIVRNIFCIIA